MITTIPDGQTITEPGAYRMSMAHYHSQVVCPGPSVSSTGIRLAENISPWAFWSSWSGNPNAYPQKDSDEFAFGRAAHCLILGDEVFAENYVLFPFPDRRTNAAKEWLAAQTKTVVTAEQIEHINRMAENLQKVPLVQAGILAGKPEVSLIWVDEKTGIYVKARPDVIQLNGQVVADLKTCASAAFVDCHRTINKYAYDMQFALAIEGIDRVFGVTATDAVVVFVEKTPPYHVRTVPIGPDELYWAKARIRRGLDKVAAAIKTPPLPVYDDDETPYKMSDWQRQRFEQEQSDGRLPNV